MKPAPAQRALFGAAVLIPLAAVGAALFTQHVWDMQPCPWCVLQRVIFVAIAAVALPGWLLRSRGVQLGSAVLVLLLAVAGIAAGLWQHLVAAASSSCNLTLADRIISGLGLDAAWPEVFAAYASCAEAAVKLFGVPYVFFSIALFALLAAIALRVLVGRRAG